MIAWFLQDLRVRAKSKQHSRYHVIFLNINLFSRTLSYLSYCYCVFVSISFLIMFALCFPFLLFVFVASLSEEGVIFVTSQKTLKFVMPKPLWTVVHDRMVLARSKSAC